MALLIRPNQLPTSSRILLGCLVTVSLMLLLIKVNNYRSPFVKEGTPFHDIQVPYIQLIPKYTIFYPWVVVTLIFAEISVFSFVLSTTVLVGSTKYVEKFWGFKEVVKFVFIVGSATNFVTVLLTIVSNIVRKDAAGMDRPLGGGILYYFGFLVVLKQLIPEHNIVLFNGLINFRVKHLPFIGVCVALVWSVLISGSMYPFFPSVESFVISYCYLRFYQTFSADPLLPMSSNDAGSIIRGDASDAFKLVEFFPEISKQYLGVAFDKIYEVSVLVGIITPFDDDTVEQGNIRAQKRTEQINQTQKSVANSVAERRRQVALQVIEDRINRESRT